MNLKIRFSLPARVLLLTLVPVLFGAVEAHAQVCSPLLTGLQLPVGMTLSNRGNLLVSESGTRNPNTGRLSILDADGNRRVLLENLPSGINDVGDPSGPAGLFIRGRTLYVAMGVGDVGRAGPSPGTDIPNPNPLSSPLFSSVLAIQSSANVEANTGGFSLSLADHQTLASGGKVTLSNGNGDRLTIEMIANFPDYVANPLPTFPANVRLSNPFSLVAADDRLYVTDGGRNLVWQIDLSTGAFSVLASFPAIPNPLFPVLGGPFSDAVPTGIAFVDGQLLVTLFRGAPFAPGTSVVERVDPNTGDHSAFITGLKTAIDVLPIREKADTDLLVLQHASVGPFFASPGQVLRFEIPPGTASILANCLIRPTSMVLDEKAGRLYVTEFAGAIVVISIP